MSDTNNTANGASLEEERQGRIEKIRECVMELYAPHDDTYEPYEFEVEIISSWEDEWTWEHEYTLYEYDSNSHSHRDVKHTLDYELIRVEKVELTAEQILDLLNGKIRNLRTTNWQGTVILESIDGCEKKIDEPAYGGHSNTNGTSEKGSFEVTLDFLLDPDTRIDEGA